MRCTFGGTQTSDQHSISVGGTNTINPVRCRVLHAVDFESSSVNGTGNNDTLTEAPQWDRQCHHLGAGTLNKINATLADDTA